MTGALLPGPAEGRPDTILPIDVIPHGKAPGAELAVVGGMIVGALLVFAFVKNAKVSGVGFGMGDVTLENFLITRDLILSSFGGGAKVLVTRFDDVPYEEYLKLTENLRAAGITASLYLGSKKFGKQLDYAVKTACTHICVMGGDELAKGVVRVKDLSTREERDVPLAEITKAF